MPTTVFLTRPLMFDPSRPVHFWKYWNKNLTPVFTLRPGLGREGLRCNKKFSHDTGVNWGLRKTYMEIETVHTGGVLWKKDVLKNFAKFTGKHLCWSCNFFKKETPTKVFSSEFCEIFRNSYFAEHLRTGAFDGD